MSCVGILVFCLSLSPLFASEVDKTCSNDQMRCRNGACISLAHKCDGIVHCPDGSDETHALCWNNKCQADQFRCTYGACVNGTAPCNGVPACADYSDELLPKCRNETLGESGQFKCFDGTFVPETSRCDGLQDCADGSDETLWTCAAMYCPLYLFQCAYGACVDLEAVCNKVKECDDGSDEDDALCENFQKPKEQFHELSQQSKCILPSYPSHGIYTAGPNAKPGDVVDLVTVNVTCKTGYGVNGSSSVFCFFGWWSEQMPQCVMPHPPHPSVEYNCQVSSILEGSRPCNEYELTGTVVKPRCRSPNYYSPIELPDMQCVNGSWSYIAKCKPECGIPTRNNWELVIGGATPVRERVPWHAGIYTKTTKPYKQICGGSLISEDIIISAAHCFWSNVEGKKLPATNYAAAVGKLFRPWNDKYDEGQRSDVKKIHLPARFQGSAANYQDDIAVVVVTVKFQYNTFIQPLCVDFDAMFDNKQLQSGSYGKVAGWGLKNVTCNVRSGVLTALELPYVNIQTCIAESPSYRALITSHKLCAGFKGANSFVKTSAVIWSVGKKFNLSGSVCLVRANKAVCQGDSGAGLAFPELDRGVNRYYLRGIMSTGPNPDTVYTCNVSFYTTFTHLLRHEHFIKQFWMAY